MALAQSSYDHFFFTSNATQWLCPHVSFPCIPPDVCAHDPIIDEYYCCRPGANGAEWCYRGSVPCTGTDGASQINCGSFCCLMGHEICTKKSYEKNVCWANATNPLNQTTLAQADNLFSSLSAAQPSATRYDLEVQNGTPAPSITSGSTSPTGSATAGIKDLTGGSNANTLGLAIGLPAGIIVAGIMLYFVLRHSRASKNTDDTEPWRSNGGTGDQAEPRTHYFG